MAKFEYMERAFSSELRPRARLVLQVLVLHCNKEGECFPSIKTIAARCGYGVSTVKRALNDLTEAGYIVRQARFDERKNGGQTSNLYTLCSVLPCPDGPEGDAPDSPPMAQPERTPAEACKVPDPAPGEQSALPPHYVYSFAAGMEEAGGRSADELDWGAVHFCTPLNRTREQLLTDEKKSKGWGGKKRNRSDPCPIDPHTFRYFRRNSGAPILIFHQDCALPGGRRYEHETEKPEPVRLFPKMCRSAGRRGFTSTPRPP